MGQKIKEHSEKAVPLIIVVGKKEEEAGTVSVRHIGEKKAAIYGLASFKGIFKS
jgi:threonyl-tRNA synthetase